MYGASGFTGSLSVSFLIEKYSQDPKKMPFRWAIAGRNKNTLERQLQKSLQEYAPIQYIHDLTQMIDIIVTSTDDIPKLRALVRNTKSMVTTVGPFSKYGTNLVALCAAYGTHLSDITGESDWVRKMIDNYEQQAARTGAILTSHAGHDCIPWELACYNAAELLRNMGQRVVRFDVYDRIQASISGGTLSSIITKSRARGQYQLKLPFDPLLSRCGQRSPHEMLLKNQLVPTFDQNICSYIGPFLMAPVVGNSVRRSCAANGYSDPKRPLIYSEKFVYNSIWSAVSKFIGMIGLAVALFVPKIPMLMTTFLPPGSGPSKQEQLDGYLLVQVVATGEKGDKTESWCYIPHDPGYYYTARMLVETGLVPILNKNELVGLPNYSKDRGGIGGYWTPASGTGPLIQKRLEGIGIKFRTRMYQPIVQMDKSKPTRLNH